MQLAGMSQPPVQPWKVHPEPPFERGNDCALSAALAEFVAHHADKVTSGAADHILGSEAAASLGWNNCTLVRLPGSNGELAGLLCLSGRSASLSPEDRLFLETMAGHAAMALENARLFTRIDQANRHWMEIFDAITDFIVVHDQADKVLRVNRSLATMIGVPPAELIGVNMRALMALTSDTASYSCPFCRSMAETTTSSPIPSSTAPIWSPLPACMERRTRDCRPFTC